MTPYFEDAVLESLMKGDIIRLYLKKALDLYSESIIDYEQLETLIAMITSEDYHDLELADMIMVNKRKQNGNTIQI